MIVEADGVELCNIYNEADKTTDEDREKARRIVACVNACSGISSTNLKRTIHDAGKWIAESHRARMDRDALVTALRDTLKVIDSLMPGLKHIAVQDYAIVNNVPFAARRLLTQITGKKAARKKGKKK